MNYGEEEDLFVGPADLRDRPLDYIIPDKYMSPNTGYRMQATRGYRRLPEATFFTLRSFLFIFVLNTPIIVYIRVFF